MADFRIETYRILDITDPTEWTLLSDLNKQIYALLLSCGVLNLNEGSLARVLLWTMFPAESVTGAKLRDPANLFILIEPEPAPGE